jgi:hypothetical protein
MAKIVRIALDKAELVSLTTSYTPTQLGRALEYLTIRLCNLKSTKKTANRFDSIPEELKIFMDEKIETSKNNLTKWKKENDQRNNQE